MGEAPAAGGSRALRKRSNRRSSRYSTARATMQRRIGQAKAEEVFQRWMNALTSACAPHTTCCVPRAAERLEMR